MGACPFCKGEVDADVLTFGGRCPSCLIEIPGEEAPTDPGAEARAAREAEEAAAQQKPPLAIIAGGLAVLLAVVGGGFAAFGPGEEPLPDIPTGAEAYKNVSSQFLKLDFDDDEPEPEPPPKKAQPKKSPGKSSSSAPSGTKKAAPGSNLPDTSNLPEAELDDVPLADAGDARPAVAEGPESTRTDAGTPAQVGSVMGTPSTPKKSLLDDDIGGGPRSRVQGEELCGDQIREPVKMIMKGLGNKLRDCSTRMLKKDDKFSSSVKVSIAVATSGQIAAIDLRPSNTDDPEFLGCIEKTIKRTKFPPLCQGVDLAKTYYFGSQR